jgi:hypothetical protein
MVGRKVWSCSLAVAVLMGARSASGDVITFTGNVTNDFSSANAPNATIYNNPADPYTAASEIAPGIFLKDAALDYNTATNTLYVGIQTYGVTGSVNGTSIATGNGLAVGFAPMNGTTLNTSNLPTFSFVAGDSNYSVGQSPQAEGRGTGLDGFNVATYSGSMTPGAINLLTGFGTTLTAGLGNLAFAPSASTPDYEFTVSNFSKLLGPNPNGSVLVMVQDGEVNASSGKSGFPLLFTFPTGAQVIPPPNAPEPTTWIIWAGLAGGAAWRYRRRSRRLLA